MQTSIDNTKETVWDALGITKDRYNLIQKDARAVLNAFLHDGKKSRMYELMILKTNNVNELALMAFTIGHQIGEWRVMQDGFVIKAIPEYKKPSIWQRVKGYFSS